MRKLLLLPAAGVAVAVAVVTILALTGHCAAKGVEQHGHTATTNNGHGHGGGGGHTAGWGAHQQHHDTEQSITIRMRFRFEPKIREKLLHHSGPEFNVYLAKRYAFTFHRNELSAHGEVEKDVRVHSLKAFCLCAAGEDAKVVVMKHEHGTDDRYKEKEMVHANKHAHVVNNGKDHRDGAVLMTVDVPNDFEAMKHPHQKSHGNNKHHDDKEQAEEEGCAFAKLHNEQQKGAHKH